VSPPPETQGTPGFVLTDAPDPRLDDVLGAELQDHVRGRVGFSDSRLLAVVVTDPATGAPIGGLSGRTSLGLFFLDLFFLPERLRGGGLGGRILAAAEAEAIRRGCVAAALITANVQAPAFYAKQGWEEFGRVPSLPGIERVFFRKTLKEQL
jgi:GNAT superfamily N-acetyltransferase